MTPEKRREQRRNEDASFRARASLENERLQARIDELDMQLSERFSMTDMEINALKEAGLWNNYTGKPDSLYIVERIKALESLLAECGSALIHANHLIESYTSDRSEVVDEMISKIEAILPKTEEVK